MFNLIEIQNGTRVTTRQTWKTTGIIGGPLQWAFQLSSNLHMQFFGKETANTKRNLGTLKDDITERHQSHHGPYPERGLTMLL